MKKTLSLLLTLVACSSVATELPALPSQQKASPHKLFLSSETDQHDFDTWKIDGGYSYNVFDNIDLYVGARVNQGSNTNESGFLSGVSYQITPRVSVKSTLHSFNEENTAEGTDKVIAAEVSSRMRLTENLDLHATLEHQEWQQELEVGIGFRF
ncbi:hypothetical protein F0224_20725 [Vibrio coralliilyticus]|uniref:hypothetical protein n=1 Tax=Vibrio coralliilyticus TaxID=190893 RepID=UPI000BAC16F3|nr:hypothetical protein [Vibrio coralliilyticus]NOI78098.1 hypothetical protein [Vibrio coralliilyticus]PAW01547.1 hypothetical protein CKJ79_21055 [Vibrio coralliilyticus]